MAALEQGPVTVVVNGMRVRVDEAAALGIKVPGAAPEPAPDVVDETTDEPAPAKGRTPANKARRAANK